MFNEDNYVQLLDITIDRFNLRCIICATTSDIVQNCIKARENFVNKYAGIASVNDKSHVADRLMEDLM